MDFLLNIWLGKPLWLWVSFILFIILLLAFDLGVLHRKQRDIQVKESLWLSLFYIIIGLSYGGWVYFYLGPQSAQEYLTGFLVEKSLSLDNIFVISLIFSFFAVPKHLLHRVLFWGILGVIFLRALMIASGAVIIEKFAWINDIFAAFLIVTGIKMLFVHKETPDLENNPVLRFLRKHMRITDTFHGKKFYVFLPSSKNLQKKELWFTPLFLALIFIECVDVIFAVDSIPAIFLITKDPFIIYTSNIFAILGLRALFFSLSSIIYRFTYLKPALALILIFIGGKVFVTWFLGIDKFPASISLGVTVLLIAGGIILSLVKEKRKI